MITEERFCKNINLMHLATISGNEDILIKILRGLHNYFPKDENGFSEIEHYCFDNNFGKPNPESDYETVENLYKRLINNQ